VTDVSTPDGGRARCGGFPRSPPGTLWHMDDTMNQHRTTEERSGGSADEPRVEAAARAVARLLANPRRTRRA
jgi:hypothetical protein